MQCRGLVLSSWRSIDFRYQASVSVFKRNQIDVLVRCFDYSGGMSGKSIDGLELVSDARGCVLPPTSLPGRPGEGN